MRIFSSHVSITSSVPFEVGVASDAMSHRRGGKPLPMEDVCLCECPLRGVNEVCSLSSHFLLLIGEALCPLLERELES